MNSLNEFHHAAIFERQIDSESEPFHRTQHAKEGPHPFGITSNLVKEKKRSVVLCLPDDNVAEPTDLEVPVRTVKAHDLTHLVDLIEPVPNIAISHYVITPLRLGQKSYATFLTSVLPRTTTVRVTVRMSI